MNASRYASLYPQQAAVQHVQARVVHSMQNCRVLKTRVLQRHTHLPTYTPPYKKVISSTTYSAHKTVKRSDNTTIKKQTNSLATAGATAAAAALQSLAGSRLYMYVTHRQTKVTNFTDSKTNITELARQGQLAQLGPCSHSHSDRPGPLLHQAALP